MPNEINFTQSQSKHVFNTVLSSKSPVDTFSSSPSQDLVERSAPGFMNGCYLSGVRVAHEGVDVAVMAARLEQMKPGSVQSIELPANNADRLAFIREWQSKHGSAIKAGGMLTLLIPLAACGGGGIGGIGGGGGGGGFLFDGPIDNAFIWRDLDGDGVYDANEPSGTTGADGSFDLAGSGGIIMALLTDAVDITTGATMIAGTILKGAPGPNIIISPVTTMIVNIAAATAVDPNSPTEAEYLAAATTVYNNLNNLDATSLPASDLLTYNAVTADDGDTDAYIAEGQVLLTLMNALEVASGATIDTNYILDQMSIAIGAGPVNFASAASISALIAAIELDQGNIFTGVDGDLATMIANMTSNLYTTVTTDGYTSDTGINAFNDSNSADILLAIAAAGGHGVDLTGQTVDYNVTEALTVGFAGVNGLITSNAVVTFTDTGDNLSMGTNVADFITFMGAVTPDGDLATTITVTSGVVEMTYAQYADAALFDVTAVGASIAIHDTVATILADGSGYIAADNPGVHVTDAATIDQLTTIDGMTTGTLTYALIGDTVANLTANVGGYVTSTANFFVTDAATGPELAALDALTTGTVTASSLSGTAADLVASDYVGSGTDVTVTDAATIAQLTALDAANGAGTLTYTDVTDTAANLKTDADTNGGLGTYVTDMDITVTDAATIAQLTGIDDATTGTVTYTSVSDTAANLKTDADTNAGLGTYVTDKNITMTTAPTLAELAAIDAATTGTLTYTSIADTAVNLAANTDGYVTGAIPVTVTGTATIDQLTTIDATTTGTLTYSLADTIANLTANVGDYVSGSVNVTVTDAATTDEMVVIDALTTGTVTASSLSGPAADLVASPYVGAGTNVTVTDAATIAQLTAIDAANGGGTLTYTAMSDNAANLAANVGSYVTGAINVTVTDAATIDQLTTISAATTGTVTYTSMTDTAANLVTNAGGFVTGAVDVTVTDAATIDQLTTISAATTGTVTYTSMTDTAANLVTNAGGFVTGAVDVTVTDAATIDQLTTIDATTTGTLTYSLADTIANLTANVGDYVSGSVNVTVTDAATTDEMVVIDALTTGTVTASSLSGPAADLVASPYVGAGTNVTVTDAATIAQLTAIDAANGGGTLTYTAMSDNAANLAANVGSYVTGAVDVTVTDDATVIQAGTIDGLTTGTLTYSLADTLANIEGGGAIVTGATSYSLIDAAGPLVVTEANQSVAAAASNIADYTFSFTLTLANETMTGSAGDDVFNAYGGVAVGPQTLNVGDILDGGDGTDTILFGTGAEANSPADGLWANKTNFEAIAFTSEGNGAQTITTGDNFSAAFTAGVDLSVETLLGAITVDMTTYVPAATINTTTQGDGAHTIVTGSGVTTVNATGVTSGAQTINGVGLTTVVASITDAGDQVIGTTTGGNITSVDAFIGGAGAQTITSTSASDVTILADAFAGTQTIVTGTGNDTVTLTSSAGQASTITTNAGNDTITLSLAIDTINVAFGGEGEDTIVNFTVGAGGDIIDFTGTTDVFGTGITLGAFGTLTGDGLGGTQVLLAGLTTIGGTTNAASLSTTDVAAFLADLNGTGDVVSFANIDNIAYIAVDDGVDTAIFKADDANGDLVIDAGDLTLIMTFSGLADATTLGTENFPDFT